MLYHRISQHLYITKKIIYIEQTIVKRWVRMKDKNEIPTYIYNNDDPYGIKIRNYKQLIESSLGIQQQQQ